MGLSASRGYPGRGTNVYRTRSRSGEIGPLGVPLWARAAHVVKFRPIWIEGAGESLRQFVNTADNTAPQVTSPKWFIEPPSFRLGVCAKGAVFAANFRRKVIKNWYEIVVPAVQMPARLTNHCRNRRPVRQRRRRTDGFLSAMRLIATCARTSQSEGFLQSRT